MGSDTKVVGQLTVEERARLCEIVEWCECPLCNGESVSFDAGKFCVACTNTGKLLSPTANILNGMKNLGYFSDADEITALRATIATLEAGLRPVFEAWDAHCVAVERMNAAREPLTDILTVTTAERAVYDERYRASEEAKREWYRAMHPLVQNEAIRALLANRGGANG